MHNGTWFVRRFNNGYVHFNSINSNFDVLDAYFDGVTATRLDYFFISDGDPYSDVWIYKIKD
jgi:hypothetical protein